MEDRERLVVVSNRLPATLRRSGEHWKTERSVGGLATAMNPILERTSGIWIGWPGDAGGGDDAQRRQIVRDWAEKDRYFVVELPPEIARRYYEGYSNETLWPLFHDFIARVTFEPENWNAYVEANQRFRDVVAEHYQPGDSIWVHDYQLMLLPKLLREALPQARIGFFLHIPFPCSEVFRILPRREELLAGVLGANLVAFQTHGHLQHFRSSLLRILGVQSRLDQADSNSRTVRLEALPIGIDPQRFLKLLETEDARKHLADMKERFAGRRVIVSVDRLDYTKGIPHRLNAFRRLIENAPQWRGKVVLMQLAVPSREHISTYARLQRGVNELVGEINGRFGTPDWTPVVYMRRGVPPAQLAAMYAAADVCWVGPLRDGMNLVAKEYVACHPEGDGALVLSEFAGAAAEMGEAILINPYDEERTAAALDEALSADVEARRDQMRRLHERVLKNHVFAWAERFLSDLRSAAGSPAGAPVTSSRPLDMEEAVRAYRAASKRLLLLDYDGTLVGYADRPEEVFPSPRLVDLLGQLCGPPGNVVAVISGRTRADIEGRFGEVPKLWLGAEHGATVRPPGESWEPLRPGGPAEWKPRLRAILEHFVERTPGSFVEEKEYALVWHYRRAEPEFGEWLANELVAVLEALLAETELRATRGQKIVEIKPLWANKGQAAERLRAACPGADFCLAVGDDRTDEDLFARLGPEAWTIHVGAGPTRARFLLPDPVSVVRLLEMLAGQQTRSAR